MADTDNDGLTNAEEIALGTSISSADSDGDGISDAIEVADGTNPKDSDSDGDGQSDGQEKVAGTDANDAASNFVDSDNDGLSDDYEATLAGEDTGFDIGRIDSLALWLDASNIDGQDNTTMSNGASISIGRTCRAMVMDLMTLRDETSPVFIAGDTPKVDLNNSSMEAYIKTHPSDELTMILSTISKVSVHGIPFFIQTTTHIAMCGLPIMPMAAMEIQA